MTAAEGYKFIAGTFLKSFGDKIPFLKTVIKDEYLDMLKAVKTPLRIKPSVSSQLKTHGIKLDDIKHIVFTHLHYDHVGDISQFKRARVWVSQKEMRAAQHPLAFFNGYNPLIAQWDYRTERILDPLVIKPEVAPFSIVKDLFGDGKVLILSTPGHTQGSLSVLVRDEDKKYFLCGDACYCRESYREERSPGRIGLYGFDHNPRLAETTRNKIMKWEQTTPELEVIPIHDTNIWSEDQLFPLPWSGS
jgi:glyoxylase-like metal-dependent hydrolase (beta-lactamase superfamily II)